MGGGEVVGALELERDGDNWRKFEESMSMRVCDDGRRPGEEKGAQECCWGGYELDSHAISWHVQLGLAPWEDVHINAKLLRTKARGSVGCHRKVSGAAGGIQAEAGQPLRGDVGERFPALPGGGLDHHTFLFCVSPKLPSWLSTEAAQPIFSFLPHVAPLLTYQTLTSPPLPPHLNYLQWSVIDKQLCSLKSPHQANIKLFTFFLQIFHEASW